jgi:steroid delta-isomerase
VADPGHIERIFARYATAMAANDFDAAAALFAPDAVVRDPVDAVPLEGREQIRGFFAAGAGVLRGFELTGPVRIAGDGTRAAAPLRARLDLGDGAKTLDSIDVMTFDEAGLVASMDAYYGPGNLNDA